MNKYIEIVSLNQMVPYVMLLISCKNSNFKNKEMMAILKF